MITHTTKSKFEGIRLPSRRPHGEAPRITIQMGSEGGPIFGATVPVVAKAQEVVSFVWDDECDGWVRRDGGR